MLKDADGKTPLAFFRIDFCSLMDLSAIDVLNIYKNTNNCNINGLQYSIAGENQEIINIFKEKGHSFENCLGTSVYYHRYELTNWLNENYKCQPFPLPLCIEYNNLVI